MPLEFQPSTPADIEAIASALVTAFRASSDATFVDRDLLRWKYFEAGPDWNGSRSYMLRKDGAIKAHCGVWPMNLQFGNQSISCNSYVDWVSDSDTPGAGVLLKKKLMKLTDAGVVVGGSADTREVVPRIGFKPVGEVATFARVIRPLKLSRQRPSESPVKAAARLGRNTFIAKTARSRSAQGWRTQQTQRFESLPELPHQDTYVMPARTAEYLNYWLRLPVTEVLAFDILKRDEVRGYFLLSAVMNQTRIADIRIWSNDPAEWAAAYGLATTTAASNSETCEVMAIASTPFAKQALLANGYRQRGIDPFFFYDPSEKLKHAPPIFLNLIDGDGAYLCDPGYPFLN